MAFNQITSEPSNFDRQVVFSHSFPRSLAWECRLRRSASSSRAKTTTHWTHLLSLRRSPFPPLPDLHGRWLAARLHSARDRSTLAGGEPANDDAERL
jgi:hypothetical protein